MAARKLKVSTTGYKENSKDKNLDRLYVPSPNLTMTNVKKHVKATPVYNNGAYGNPITMIPGVPSYTFPGAVGVIEEKLPQAQIGVDWEALENPTLAAKAKAMGHNTIAEYRNSNWGYGKNIQQTPSSINLTTTSKEAKGLEADIDKWLGNPKRKAYANAGLKDNIRHSLASMYTQQAIKDKVDIPIIGDALGFVGANAMGIGHELSTLYKDGFKDWESLYNKTIESGEDAFNNFVGSVMGLMPGTQENKKNIISNLSSGNWLPDGIVRKDGTDLYNKKQGGQLPKAQKGIEPIYVYSKDDPAYKKYLKQKAYYDEQKALYETKGRDLIRANALENKTAALYSLPDDIAQDQAKREAAYNRAAGLSYDALTNELLKEYERKFKSQPWYKYVDHDNLDYLHVNGDINTNEPSVGLFAVRKPTPVILEKEVKPKAIDIKPLPTQPIDIKPVLQNLPRPQTNKQRVLINTPQGDKVRVQDIRTKKFIDWEETDGAPVDVENPTGTASQDFVYPEPKVIKTPKFANGGDISIPDLRRVTINALPKAQSTGEFSNPDFKPSWDWNQTASENMELNRRAELAGHNSVDEYRASGWAWQPKQYQTPSVQDQVFTGRHSVAKEDVPLPTMTKSKIPGLSKSTHPDVQMLQQKEAADVAEWVDTKYKESPEETEQRNRESFIKHNITPSKEDLEGVNPETGYADAAYTSFLNQGPKLGGMTLWKPEARAGSGITDEDVNDYLNKVYKQQQEDEKVGQITLDLAFSKDLDKKAIQNLKNQLEIQKGIAGSAWADVNDSEFLKKFDYYQEGRRETIRRNNMVGTATSTFGPLDAIVALVAGAPALAATAAIPVLGTSLTVGSALNPFFYAAGINGFLNPNSDFSQAAEAWSKGTGKGEDVLWEAALNSLNFLGAKSVPTDIKNFGKAYKEIATGESIIPYAWRSPAVGLSQEASADMFNSLLNSGKLTPEENALIIEYQSNSNPFTGRFGSHTLDVAKRDALNNIINKYQLQFPQNSNVIATRRFNSKYNNLGANIENGKMNFGDRPTSFSVGVGTEGYSGAPDRLVIPSRHVKNMGNNFLVNPYGKVSDETLGFLEGSAKDFALNAPSLNEAIINERELIGTGLNFKQIGKVKNDIGGFDVIVKPRNVKAGTSTTKNATGQPQWVKPSKTQLTQEFRVEHQAKGSNYFASEEEFQKAVNEAKVEEITPEMDQAIKNKSRHASREAMIESNKNYKSWPKYRNENTVDDIYKGMQTGAEMDMPIILEFPDGTRRMFSGNTRMDVAFQSGKNPKALIVKVPAPRKQKGGMANPRDHKSLDNYFEAAWTNSRKTN